MNRICHVAVTNYPREVDVQDDVMVKLKRSLRRCWCKCKPTLSNMQMEMKKKQKQSEAARSK
jgi:hypothetical protein